MKNQFFAFISRMKYINRWGLMRNTSPENIKEHSHSVAMLAHALGVINNVYFGGSINPDRLATLAIYHDAEEIITGDLPTPVKYFSKALRSAVAEAEADAKNTLLSMLPSEMSGSYKSLFYNKDLQTAKLVKAADVLDAYIKCIEELKSGNSEFTSARDASLKKLHQLDCKEAELFCEKFLDAYDKTLDELRNMD